jgi:hypothetical protein
LVDPSGTRYSPADAAEVPGLTYEVDDSLSYAAFDVAAPLPGAWTVEITGDPTMGEQVYRESWVVQGAPYRLQFATKSTAWEPGQDALMTGSMTRAGVPYPASISVHLTTPSGQGSAVTLNDDGVLGDSIPGDRVYSGLYAIPPQDGRFELNVVGALSVGQETVTRSADTSFTAVFRPDLMIEARDITSTPTVGAVGGSLTLNLTVHNTGTASCDSFVVSVRDSSTGDAIGVCGGHVPASDSTRLAVQWTPNARGEHRISAEVIAISPAETMVDNNSSTITGLVSGPTPTPTGVDGGGGGISFALGAPAPNPTSSGLRFAFQVPHPSRVRIGVFSVQGRLVRMVVNDDLPAGTYTRAWDGRASSGVRVSSGVYFVEMVAPSFNTSRKVVLLR